jgi:hypothetical protein
MGGGAELGGGAPPVGGGAELGGGAPPEGGGAGGAGFLSEEIIKKTNELDKLLKE